MGGETRTKEVTHNHMHIHTCIINTTIHLTVNSYSLSDLPTPLSDTNPRIYQDTLAGRVTGKKCLSK